jgi:hypothetical protein
LGIIIDSQVFEKYILAEQDSLKKLWAELNQHEILSLKDQKDAQAWIIKEDKSQNLNGIKYNNLAHPMALFIS